jgi:hypothetical protein
LTAIIVKMTRKEKVRKRRSWIEDMFCSSIYNISRYVFGIENNI